PGDGDPLTGKYAVNELQELLFCFKGPDGAHAEAMVRKPVNTKLPPSLCYSTRNSDPLDKLATLCQFWHTMIAGGEPKPVFWVGSSRKDLRALPEEVRTTVGFALFQAQAGGKHVDAKPLKGFGGASVLEVVEDHDGNTYRAVYTVRFAGAVYVLHAFQKKSKKGIKTPVAEMNLIRQRLKVAEEHHEERRAEEERRGTGPH